MFNIGAGEFLIILVVALVVLGPERLPGALRKAGQVISELRKMSAGFQDELREALDEPMRDLQSTAEMFRNPLTALADAAEAAAAKDAAGSAEAGGVAAPEAPGDFGPPSGAPVLMSPPVEGGPDGLPSEDGTASEAVAPVDRPSGPVEEATEDANAMSSETVESNPLPPPPSTAPAVVTLSESDV